MSEKHFVQLSNGFMWCNQWKNETEIIIWIRYICIRAAQRVRSTLGLPQMFIQKIVVIRQTTKCWHSRYITMIPMHNHSVVLSGFPYKIHHHRHNPFSDWDVVYQCFITTFCLFKQSVRYEVEKVLSSRESFTIIFC